ncbi:MAG: DUF3052 family protein [Alteraurantiacibacter sp.]
MSAGFSGPPLARLLDLRDGQRVWFYNMPDEIEQEIAEYALELTIVSVPEEGVDAAHIFSTECKELSPLIEIVRGNLSPDGQIWVSWPTQSSGIQTDIDDTAIRELGQSLGLVGTKICAIGDDWEALKLVIRKELR